MGASGAFGMSEAVHDGTVSIDAALHWHLRSNHYPPVPNAMIPVAKAAIEAGNDDEYDRLIDLPEGVEYRDGRSAVEAWVIINSFHLEAFVDDIVEEA